MISPLRIGTRGSPLALWQANHIADLIRPFAAPRPIELVLIETLGDLVRDRALSAIGGDGLFTKEIQKALQADAVDVAVHSLKDLPTHVVEGLTLAAVPERGPTGDVFVSRRFARFADLPVGAILATSSLRRRAQILYHRSDLKLIDIRGNIDTRLRKLDEQELDGILLAQAGLVRIGRSADISEILDPEWMLPAVGQGALGLECRTDDRVTLDLLRHLNHATTHYAVLAERAMLRGLGGGCQVPIGAATRMDGDRLVLRGVVLPQDGSRRVTAFIDGAAVDADQLGHRVADKLWSEGARELLESPSA